jgi:TDG/mug DNA glycosylase family protein
MAVVAYEPDILTTGLDVVFCGLNPAATAAADGFNFSSPSNRFWQILYSAGFTDVRIAPSDERRLLAYRCGITAIVRRPTRRAEEITPTDFVHARPALEKKLRQYEPRSVAFLGKRGFSSMLNQRTVPWGRQPERFAGAIAWVLPNPSGRNRGFSLEVLIDAYGELRRSLSRG